MKYRDVKIIPIKWLDAIDIGKREDSLVKAVFKTGYGIIGTTYPDTLAGAKASVDHLISLTMSTCNVNEKEAVALLNAN